MKIRRKALWITILLLTISVLACVTINIYFPAEKVESVADEIVDEIRGREPSEKENDKQGGVKSLIRNIRLAFTPSQAWAQDVKNVSNATIRALKEKMKARYSLMKPYYDKGVLKEGNDGYLSIGTTKGLGLKQKRDLKNLVDAENNDRSTLYKEVAKALDIDGSQVSKIAEIFAKEWQE